MSVKMFWLLNKRSNRKLPKYNFKKELGRNVETPADFFQLSKNDFQLCFQVKTNLILKMKTFSFKWERALGLKKSGYEVLNQRSRITLIK